MGPQTVGHVGWPAWLHLPLGEQSWPGLPQEWKPKNCVPLRLQLLDEGSAKSSTKTRIKELQTIANEGNENLL